MKALVLRMDVQVILALVLAVFVGANFPAIGLGSEWMGTIFLNTLKMIIPFLLFFSIFTSVLGMGDPKYMGALGGRTLGLYLLTTCLAVTTAIALMNLFQPWSCSPSCSVLQH
jgi:Na+/H+-dicarboxylate symporter